MFKKFITNSVYSFLSLLLLSLIFTFGGFLVLDLFKFGIIILFFAVLFLGYLIGCKLYYAKTIGVVSIIILPLIVFVALYGLSIIGIPFISMIIQYPAAVWSEAVGNVRLADNHPITFFAVALVHYIVCSISLFIGAKSEK